MLSLAAASVVALFFSAPEQCACPVSLTSAFEIPAGTFTLLDADDGHALLGDYAIKKARIFDLASGELVREIEGGTFFGKSGAVEGDWVVVGTQSMGPPIAYRISSGEAVWAFTDFTNWPTPSIDISNGKAAIASGTVVKVFDLSTGQSVFSHSVGLPTMASSVCLDGSRLVVGYALSNIAGPAFSGGVRVFDISSQQQLALLTPTDPAEWDQFGIAVASLGELVAVAASGDDNELGTDAGALYLFSAAGWQQQMKIAGASSSTVSLAPSLVLSGEIYSVPHGVFLGSGPVARLTGDGRAVGANGVADLSQQLRSACCLATSCLLLDQPSCASVGGEFQGVGVVCQQVNCNGEVRPQCPEDINRDGVVDGADLAMLLGAWGSCR